jgi:GMP synthase (glutamine-hydrolysing)
MQRSVIIVRHHHRDMDDIASVHLADRGFALTHCFPFDAAAPNYGLDFDLSGVAGVVVKGGPQNVTELSELPYLQRELDWIKACIEAEVPVIGICLGAQLLAHALGGIVTQHPEGLCEFGYVPVYPSVDDSGKTTSWLTEPLHMVQAHFEGFTLPPGCTSIATGATFAHQAFHYNEKAFGFQFHPEVSEAMFTNWQKAEEAKVFYSANGVQDRHEASQDNLRHNAAQKAWFCDVLDRVFPVASG